MHFLSCYIFFAFSFFLSWFCLLFSTLFSGLCQICFFFFKINEFCAHIPDRILDLLRPNKYRMVVGVSIDDLFHIMLIVENVAMGSMLAFVVACVVAPDWACQHSNRVNIDVSIRCQFVVTDDFLFRQHFELVLILVVYQMDHADPDEVTEMIFVCFFFKNENDIK